MLSAKCIISNSKLPPRFAPLIWHSGSIVGIGGSFKFSSTTCITLFLLPFLILDSVIEHSFQNPSIIKTVKI